MKASSPCHRIEPLIRAAERGLVRDRLVQLDEMMVRFAVEFKILSWLRMCSLLIKYKEVIQEQKL